MPIQSGFLPAMRLTANDTISDGEPHSVALHDGCKNGRIPTRDDSPLCRSDPRFQSWRDSSA
jgi:hypothetical protein